MSVQSPHNEPIAWSHREGRAALAAITEMTGDTREKSSIVGATSGLITNQCIQSMNAILGPNGQDAMRLRPAYLAGIGEVGRRARGPIRPDRVKVDLV